MPKKIVIVGGGSAGWMSATTFIRCFPDWDISLIESPNIPISGVGESTLQSINTWMRLVKITDKDFMKACDASYKLSIKFTNFYKNGDGGFHYPFSDPDLDGTRFGLNDWHIKNIYKGPLARSDYADSFFSCMALVNQNKFDKNTSLGLPNFRYGKNTSFHFDATKFGIWLRDNICVPEGVKHIQSTVNEVIHGEHGIEALKLDNKDYVQGDLFIDCTGFRSRLLGGEMKVPFTSFEDYLPNNRAWAVQVPYLNKEEQLKPYTGCHALGNGWVWDIPLWSRIGKGYVYSDKFTTPEDALTELKEHLSTLGYSPETLQFKDIKMRIGMHEKMWEKNVVGIGLSAGFIEPLESNGLFVTHEYLTELMRILQREEHDDEIVATEFDKGVYNLRCTKMFTEFTHFVILHYALSARRDTPYWKALTQKNYDWELLNPHLTISSGMRYLAMDRMSNNEYQPTGGPHCVATGLNWMPIDRITEEIDIDKLTSFEIDSIIKHLDDRKERWNNMVKSASSLNQYLGKTIYADE